MRDQGIILLTVLAIAASTKNGDEKHRGNIFSRMASRATGAVVDIVDPDTIIDQVDVNALMEKVDVNALLDRVDPQVILDNVDVNALMDRVDVDALMERVDVDALLDRVDVKELTDRAGIPEIVRESTGELAGSAMDVVRRQIVALDTIVGRASYRLVRRDPAKRPTAPPSLQAGTGIDEAGRGQVTGHYAGPVSRLAAYAADALIVGVSLMLILMAFTFVTESLFKIELAANWQSGVAGVVFGALWNFTYFFLSWALAGRTIGMALTGLRVTTREGNTISGRAAFVRALMLPVSFLVFGLGFLGILISPERRALHDAAAGTVVIYDWGDRPAELPAPLTAWVIRHEGEPNLLPDPPV